MMQILRHTPTWVFVLFAMLLVFGYLQTRSREVRQFMAYCLPLGMVALSLAGVQSSFGFAAGPASAWAVGLAAATWSGYRFFPLHGAVYDARNRAFFIPGSWMPFAVIMAIFFAKYVFAVMRALGVALVDSTAAATILSFAYGCFSGYFFARAVALFVQAQRARTALGIGPATASPAS
jgi:hypothetical protein